MRVPASPPPPSEHASSTAPPLAPGDTLRVLGHVRFVLAYAETRAHAAGDQRVLRQLAALDAATTRALAHWGQQAVATDACRFCHGANGGQAGQEVVFPARDPTHAVVEFIRVCARCATVVRALLAATAPPLARPPSSESSHEPL